MKALGTIGLRALLAGADPVTPRSPRHVGLRRYGAALVASLMLAGLLPGAVLAANTVTPASGGSAISADTNSVNGNGAWTTLTGPQLNGTGGTLPAGTQTFTIADAGEFEFRSGVGSADLTGAGCGTLAISSGPTVVAASVSVTLTGASSGTCHVVLSGLQVRPTAVGAVPLETSAIQATGIVAGPAGTLTVVAGAAILEFTQGPIGNASAGANLSPQPVVHDEDQYSNPRAGDQITVSVKAGTGTSGAVVTCTTNTVATGAAGNATFAGCDVDKPGTGYRLLATTPGGTSGESNTFNITGGAATKLFFLAQPSRGTPGGAFATQPVIEIQDSAGNRVTTDSSTDVTLAITTKAGSGTLTCSGGLTKEAVNGLVAFGGCSINNAEVGYKITATSSPVLAQAVSNPFDVADRLVFRTQPSATTGAGIAFAAQPVIAVRAGASDTAVNDDVTVVTLSIKAGTGAAAAVLSCPGGLSKTVVNGVAAFTGCAIDKVSPTSPANPYKIVASATNLTSAESSNVTIASGPASKLGFTAQPNAGVAAQVFTIQPVVAVQDAGGNTVTTGASSTATVTLAIGSNPGGGTLTCTGGLSRNAVAGVATFAGCSINSAGVGYTLVATSTGLTSATSTAFTVTVAGGSITLYNSASTITWGRAVSFVIQMGANGANKQVILEGARDGKTFGTVANLTTNSLGRATFTYRPPTNRYYRVRFLGTSDLAAGVSNTTRTVVRQISLLRPTNAGAVKLISRNTSITFVATVRPSRPELAPARITFAFYRLVGGTWTLQTKRDVYASAVGLASTTYKFATAGGWYVRSVANPTTYNANSVWSPVERYDVH